MRKHNKNSCDWIAGSSSAMTTALLITTVLFSFDARATTCTATPECAALGYKYTEAECEKGAVKCPNGNSYYCPNPRLKCNIGWIYYSDGTCSAPAAYTTSKTVLGIVVHVNDNGVGGQVMAPWPIDTNGNKTSSNSTTMIWGGYGTDISSLPNFTSQSSASTDYDSCGNTDKIVAQGNASTYPAAWAARKYAPTEATKGKWCLPAAGIMTNIYNNQGTIQDAISKVGGVSYPSCCNWSSSEYNYGTAWFSTFDSSYGLDWNLTNDYNYVRPVLAF